MAETKIIQPVVVSTADIARKSPESFEDASRGLVSWHTLISADRTPTDSLSAGIAHCPPDSGYLAHHRHSHAELYHVLSGQGVVVIDGISRPVRAGDTVFIPGNAEHGVKVDEGCTEGLKWLYVFATASFSDIVYRFS